VGHAASTEKNRAACRILVDIAKERKTPIKLDVYVRIILK
jgi:hypothetical protein